MYKTAVRLCHFSMHNWFGSALVLTRCSQRSRRTRVHVCHHTQLQTNIQSEYPSKKDMEQYIGWYAAAMNKFRPGKRVKGNWTRSNYDHTHYTLEKKISGRWGVCHTNKTLSQHTKVNQIVKRGLKKNMIIGTVKLAVSYLPMFFTHTGGPDSFATIDKPL